jgi:hypothetical protein
MTRIRIGVVLFSVVGLASTAAAQSSSAAGGGSPAQIQQVRDELDQLKKEFEALRQQYEQRISTLEQRLGSLSGPRVIDIAQDAPVPQAPPPGLPAPPAPAPSGLPPVGQAAAYSAGSKIFNPDISAIGNFLGVAGKNPNAPEPALEMTEAELGFQAVIDPYARADFFVSGGPEGFEIEEGYVTFNTLPAGLLLKAGKLRAQFGKVNTMHTHVLPWADRPLVSENLVGGEEGLSDSGVSLSKLIPNDFVYLEATGELYQGESDVFQTDRRSRLVYLGRLRGYHDLTESTNLDLGVSFAHGPTDVGDDLGKALFGIDATLRWRPLQRGLYQQFVGRTELIWSRQQLPTILELDDTARAFGLYASGDYQFARRWFTGIRLDRSGRALEPTLTDTGAALHVTFRPTEFSQIRGQYRRTNYAEGISGNELLFQLNFSIGAHGAHVF